MEYIFHEKQEGQLCAQHALNCLLQDQYFTAVDLATLAQQLDDEERKKMAEGGMTEEFRKFLNSGSSNMDDSGFFSVQVIQQALTVWSLELLPYQSRNPICDSARANPTLQKAYICNFKEHWFTLRKIGQQWFNLNSLLSGPELVSDTYLSLLLIQLINDGYSIFVVNGILPDCKADQVLANQRVTQTQKPRLLSDTKKGENSRGNDGFSDDERSLMESTIAASLASHEEAERKQLEAAMALSLQQGTSQSYSAAPTEPMSEEEQLKQALKMSLEQ